MGFSLVLIIVTKKARVQRVFAFGAEHARVVVTLGAHGAHVQVPWALGTCAAAWARGCVGLSIHRFEYIGWRTARARAHAPAPHTALAPAARARIIVFQTTTRTDA